VIGIENKIYHFLHNDLSDYSSTVKSLCAQTKKKPINIILSLNKLSSEDLLKANTNNFIAITYEDLFRNIKKEIGEYMFQSNVPYLIFLNDFIKSIQNLKPATMENKQLWNFFKENRDMVEELTQKYDEYRRYLQGKVAFLKQMLPSLEYAPSADDCWIYKENPDHCLVYDFTIEGTYKISTDTYLSPLGWEIQLFGRGKPANSVQYLFETMCQDSAFLEKPLNQFEINGDGRIVINRFDVETDLQKVGEALKDLLSRIENYKSKTEQNI
jgi:hypothetical protein